jgi:hypothetical protein
MKRTIQLLVLLLMVLVPALFGWGMDLGVRIGTQSPSLAIQAEADITPSLSMGLFLAFPFETIVDLSAFQTPSFTIGLTTKYRFTQFGPALVPYVGVEGGFTLAATDTPLSLGVLAGVRIYPVQNIYLFTEAAISLFPFPDATDWFKDLYLGIGFRI